MTWPASVELAFTELRLAGAGSPHAARRLQAALQDLLTVAAEDRRPPLRTQRDLLTEASDTALDNSADSA